MGATSGLLALIIVEMDGDVARLLLVGIGDVPRLLVGLINSRLRVLVYVRYDAGVEMPDEFGCSSSDKGDPIR